MKALLSIALASLLVSGCSSPLGLENICGLGLVHAWDETIVGGTDSIRARDWGARLSDSQRAALKRIDIGILRNPARRNWDCNIEDMSDDDREDESELFRAYLEDSGLFGRVLLVDRVTKSDLRYVVSCNVECIYSVRIDGWAYACNIFPYCGFGFLLGFPYRDATAFYTGQAVFFDPSVDPPEVITGSAAANYKTWSAINLYSRPRFYSSWNLRPIFEQWLNDLISRGCLEAPSEHEPTKAVANGAAPPSVAAPASAPSSDTEPPAPMEEAK